METSGDLYTAKFKRLYLLVSRTDNYRRRHKSYAVICIESDIPELVRLAVAVKRIGRCSGSNESKTKKTLGSFGGLRFVTTLETLD